jgi:hypothetical protein
MDEPVTGRRGGHDRARGQRDRPGTSEVAALGARRMATATEATPEMAAYFLGALRDQSSRAGVFRRQLRWERLRHSLAAEESVVAEAHLLESGAPAPELTTSEEPTQVAAG